MADENGDKLGYFLHLQEILNGGVISTADVAVKMAELVVAHLYGEDEVTRQRPFEAKDEGDHWHVEGSWNRDRRTEGEGAAKIWIRKRDAKIMDMTMAAVMHISPEVRRILDEALKEEKTSKD